jgi:hypothetical protein
MLSSGAIQQRQIGKLMKKLGIIVLLALATLLANCGSRTVSQQNLTGTGGNWEAELTGGTGDAALLAFTTQFNTGFGGGAFNIYYFSFINTNPCFTAIAGETGSATLSTNGADQVTGSLTYTVNSNTPSGITLSLTTAARNVPNTTPPVALPSGNLSGTASGSSGNTALENGAVDGNWILSSTNPNYPNCNGYGSFLMCQESATCTVSTGTD